LYVKNGVVLYQQGKQLENPDTTWTTNKAGLFAICRKDEESIKKFVTQSGDTTLLSKLLEGVTGFNDQKFFNIIEP
jgi:alkyl sulfatase BDS1-like metallo-beta-lactamase superfamily hydrolase